MHIQVCVKDEQGESHDVGRMLMPVVPRIGETVYLNLSLTGNYSMNPASPVKFNTAYFKVVDVAYEAYNTEDIEEGMGAAPYSEGSTAYAVQLFVTAINENTDAYVQRIIARDREG